MATNLSGESKKKQVVSGRTHQRMSMTSLPSDVVSARQLDDLRIAFSIYEIEKSGTILLSNLRVLLWNFGHWRISKKDMEKLLRNQDFDLRKQTIDWKDVLALIAKKYSGDWNQQEAHDTFVALDRRDRGSVTHGDLKTRLQGILDIGISDSDMAELYTLAEVDPGAALHLEDLERM
jgi:Ca2+-binding EF-hand superfamily protein